MTPRLNVAHFVKELLILLGWATRSRYIEVAGPVTVQVKKTS